MLCRVQQRAFGDRYIRAFRHLLAIEQDDEACDALHTLDSKDAMIDPREEYSPAKGPALSIIAAFEGMEILEKRLFDVFLDHRKIGVVIDNDFHVNLYLLIGRP